MSISDIIWPWGALRRERKTQEGQNQWFLTELAHCEERLNSERERADNLSNKVIRLSDENLRYRRWLNNSHYRDPKTGRIGKQGEYPL